jgi:hypothetical protein
MRSGISLRPSTQQPDELRPALRERLLVRDRNERAKAVYRKLGFVRFDPDADVARRFNSAADTPDESFRMILRKG